MAAMIIFEFLGGKELWAIVLGMSDQECGVCNHA